MAQFSNAQHFIIQGGNFTSAVVHQNNKDSESGLDALSFAVSHGAIHDSAERHPPPNCHPDTRKAVQQVILDWISNDNSALPLLWLYGPAGAGKTAILQAIAEILCKCDGKLGGSFFFSRGKHGRDQGHFLFSTIAYQLALNIPGLRQHINRIMEIKPTLHTKSITVQLQALIVDAFQSLSPPPQCSYVVIIDGLDECQDKTIQQSIVRLLCDTITVCKLPLRFLIGSRPESHIRASFDHQSLHTITQRVVLDETFNPRRDIRVFLQDGFAEICVKHADILSHVQQPWPGEGIVDLLVQRSSGQFIYAATALKFVGADFCNPTKQLALVLEPSSTAFSDLDQLYTQILSVYPSPGNIVQVLGVVAVFNARGLTAEVIEDILEMEEGEVKVLLRGLSSLIAFVGDDNEEYQVFGYPPVGSVYFLHASFRDYLVDSSRSGPFYINEEEYKNWVTTRSFALLIKWIGRSWRSISTTRLPRNETWSYLRSHLPWCFVSSPIPIGHAIMTGIDDLVLEFWKVSGSGMVDVSLSPMLCLMGVLHQMGGHLANPGDQFLKIFHGYKKILYESFILAFLKPGSTNNLLRSLPGIVVQRALTMQGMAELYGVGMDLLEHLSECQTLEPHSEPMPYIGSSYILERHLSEFLQDQVRARLHYCDPTLHHIFICRRSLSLLDGSNASDIQSNGLSRYFQLNLYDHLCTASEIFLRRRNIPGDHPAVQILNDLDRITYLDENQSHFKSYLAPYAIPPILRWAAMLTSRLKAAAVFISGVNLIERLCQITDRIYWVILFIETHGSLTTVTIRAPFRGPCTDSPSLTAVKPGVVHLSLELLTLELEDRNYSFTDFITTPERSGPMHISADVYHTQITEHFFMTVALQRHSTRPSFGKYIYSVSKHISRALPTKTIFYLLRAIDFLNYDPSRAELQIMLLETTIKWLEGLGSERAGDLCDHLQATKLTLKGERWRRIGDGVKWF